MNYSHLYPFHFYVETGLYQFSLCNVSYLSNLGGFGLIYVFPLKDSLCSNPPQSSCLRNPIDRGAWWATVHGVTETKTAK